MYFFPVKWPRQCSRLRISIGNEIINTLPKQFHCETMKLTNCRAMLIFKVKGVMAKNDEIVNIVNTILKLLTKLMALQIAWLIAQSMQ